MKNDEACIHINSKLSYVKFYNFNFLCKINVICIVLNENYLGLMHACRID